MKKNIFLFAFLVPIMMINAQTQDFFGVKFGANASSMSFSNDNTTEKYNSNISYYVGFFGEVKLKNKLYIKPHPLEDLSNLESIISVFTKKNHH